MKTTTTTTLFALLWLLPAAVTAFSSMAVPYPNNNNNNNNNNPKSAKLTDGAATLTIEASAPWRVVLDIGREPLSSMPFDWARSGGRMPVKIPCDFQLATSSSDDGKMRIVQPQSDTVSFTGPDGAVVRPIVSGNYKTSSKDSNHPQELAFDLTFPQELARRDVTIPAGTTVTCTARMYTQTELDALYQAFYDARDEAWRLGGELNDMMTIQGPPKVWNEEAGRWEKRSKSINPLQWAQKRLAYTSAKAQQDQKNKARPDPNDLSERGPFPGIDDNVYVAKQGIAKTQNGAVIGRWSMEPMLLDKPVSYRK
eukprot:scaffold7227_cov160-Amphora_coffeaeformis.AAC.10